MMSAEIQEKIRDLGQVLEYMYSIAREYHAQLQEVKYGKELLEKRIISQKEELDNQYNELRKAYDADKDKWNSSLADWKASIDSLNKIRIADEKILDERRQELSSKEANFEIHKEKENKRLSDREKNVALRERSMDKMKREIERLSRENEILTAFKCSLEKELEEQKGQYTALKEEYENLTGKYNDLNNANSKLRENYDNLKNSLESFKNKNEELQKEIDNLSQKMNTQSDCSIVYNEETAVTKDNSEGSDNGNSEESVSSPRCARDKKTVNKEQEGTKEVRETDVKTGQETKEETQEGAEDKVVHESKDPNIKEIKDHSYYNRR